ncbi:lipopolysaccharide biosynthesis protein [Geodermatophilus sp. SYSU D01036]
MSASPTAAGGGPSAPAPDAASPVPQAAPESGGDVRSGLTVLAASMVGHAGNYLFYVVAARMLGAAQFAEVSALIAYSLICFQPLNGVQAAAARDAARLAGQGDAAGLSALVRTLARGSGWGTLGATLALLAVGPLLTAWLDLSTWTLAAVAALWIPLGGVLLVGTGVLQGLGAFGRVALVLAGPLGALRTALLPICVLLIGLSGAVWAMVAATVIGLLLLAGPLRRAARPAPGTARFSPGTSIVALLAFASLTNLDQLVSKAALAPEVAGVYAAAALMGKVSLYAPAALTMVLLPRVAADLARGREPIRPVLLTMGVTAVTGLAITGALALVPASLLAATFGPEFADAARLMVPLSLVMTLASLLYVHLTLAIARSSRSFPVLLLVAALAHGAVLALWHGSPEAVIAASAVVIGVTTLVHEVASPHGTVRMVLRAAAARRTAST